MLWLRPDVFLPGCIDDLPPGLGAVGVWDRLGNNPGRHRLAAAELQRSLRARFRLKPFIAAPKRIGTSGKWIRRRDKLPACPLRTIDKLAACRYRAGICEP